jgi:hypothetical protein
MCERRDVRIDAQYSSFMRLNKAVTEQDGVAILEQGQALAQRLRSAAIDFSYSKATEFSPLIEKYFLMAAKVAFLAYGEGAADLKPYEPDVYYYRNFDPPSYIVWEYEDFKRSQQST